ncbi:MAG: type II toxin-antitoxin system PemK/MazF family toxin [Chloroflexi bacterium]|nr:type II toxin-antitoxin system PemK/MazF family toxin [Chloroflexota bacterium]
MLRPFAIGDVLIANVPVRRPLGHEQEGLRPVIIVGIPDLLALPRFPMLLVIPLTSDRGQPWSSRRLYPQLPKEAAGLDADSIALLDQLCALDPSRFLRFLGKLSGEHLRAIREGLRQILAFDDH